MAYDLAVRSLEFFPVNLWVLPAALPYIAIAGYDFWLHETDRVVPRLEGLLHATVITGVVSFLGLATLGKNLAAAVVLGIMLVAAVFDELGYHGNLDAHEKRLHWFGGAALSFCIGVWLWTT
jgi:hypothetical protein